MAPDADEVLTLRNVSKTFPGTKALREVDIDVHRGEVHALVGQNGSGKSTLIKILAGYHTPDPGAQASVDGQDFQLGHASAAQAAGLRFVHQDLGLVPTLDSVDNLALGFGYATGFGGRVQWRKQRARAREALHGLDHEFDVRTPVSHLSAFEKTALAIARAIQNMESHVSLLVLDEPTATMPRPEVDRLFTLIRRVKAQGTSVLLVSHHLDEVFAIADRVTVFRDGRNEATRTVAGLESSELVRLMTGGKIEDVSHPASAAEGVVALSAQGLGGAVLENFDLNLHRGEIVGIAGLNGSGRDEVCELLFGARPRTGVVEVNGKVLPPARPDVSVGRGLALVPADRHKDGLVLSHSVRENITLADVGPFWQRARLNKSAERKVVTSWVKKLSIKTNSSETLVEALSGGNQQKVVMGKWLRMDPLVLLLDEPTQGVDVGAQAEVHRLMRSAADSGSAVLVCSSDESELSRVCDRVIILCHGVVEAELHGDQASAPRIAQHSLRVSVGG